MKKLLFIIAFCFSFTGCSYFLNKTFPELYENMLDEMDINCENENSNLVTNTLNNKTDYHFYYFETSENKAKYKISVNKTDVNIFIYDDESLSNQLSKIEGSAYDNEDRRYTLSTNSQKTIYIVVKASYSLGATYTLTVSGQSDSDIVLHGDNEENKCSVKSDNVTASLTSGSDSHIYYFETDSKYTSYKIERTDYDSDQTDIVISDDSSFYNKLAEMDGYKFNTDDKACIIKTVSKKKIYIRVFPTKNYDMYAGKYKLQVSAKTDEEIELHRYN